METITAIGFIFGLSVVLALVLAVANAKLKVFEDPRIDAVEEALPGANCGACGAAGCRSFADSVVKGEIEPSRCTVGGTATAEFIANYLGIDAGSAEKKVARLLCAGGSDVASQAAAYEGFSSCRSAAAVTGGPKGCAFGCIGLSDCEEVCGFGAIQMAPNGLPVVDVSKCTACGDCVTVCPKKLFEIMPLSRHLIVQCKSLLAGEEAEALCSVACTACGRCVADAPTGLLEMKNNLPALDIKKLDLQTSIATFRCPTSAIVWIEAQQFPELYDDL
ncbi:MAG: Fe-S cluster protein [Candidatus Cloacimonetes bacterium 4572_55]|nr:MAG: Fe-S cluster protein [Candidatus Cloacimonetes bacterium 4572_55]